MQAFACSGSINASGPSAWLRMRPRRRWRALQGKHKMAGALPAAAHRRDAIDVVPRRPGPGQPPPTRPRPRATPSPTSPFLSAPRRTGGDRTGPHPQLGPWVRARPWGRQVEQRADTYPTAGEQSEWAEGAARAGLPANRATLCPAAGHPGPGAPRTAVPSSWGRGSGQRAPPTLSSSSP